MKDITMRLSSHRFLCIYIAFALFTVSSFGESVGSVSFLNRNISVIRQKVSLYVDILKAQERDEKVESRMMRDVLSDIDIIGEWIDDDFLLIISDSKKLNLGKLFVAENKSRLLSRLTEIRFALDGVHEKLPGNSSLQDRLEIVKIQLSDLTKFSERIVKDEQGQ